jgi:hypothetical protein
VKLRTKHAKVSCIIEGFLVGGFAETLHYRSEFLTHNKNLHILWDADIRPGLFCLLCEGFQQELATLERLPRNLPRPSSTPSSFALLHVVFLGHHYLIFKLLVHIPWQQQLQLIVTLVTSCRTCPSFDLSSLFW